MRCIAKNDSSGYWHPGCHAVVAHHPAGVRIIEARSAGGSVARGAANGHAMNTWRVVDPSRIARRGLRALELLATASLAAGVLLWWLITGHDGIGSPAGLVYAVLLAGVLVLPGLLLVHVARTLSRAARLMLELREQVGEAGLRGEEWASDGRLLARTLRLALRERGAGVIATPWYWLLALWAAAAAGVLILGAVALGLATLL